MSESSESSPAAPAYEAPPNGFRTFVIVWITQAISVFGSALTFFAIIIWLTQVQFPLAEQKPQLAAAISAISLAFGLPIVFIAPIAGAWADRHDRKRIMMSMDAVSGLLSVTLLALIVTHTLTVWLLVPLVLLFAITGQFHSSAFDTSYAMLVPEKQLPRANGMMQTIWSLSGILSPLIAANIIALPALARGGNLPGFAADIFKGMTDGTPLAIGVDAVTFFAAAATLLFLQIPSPKRADMAAGAKKPSIWADVREGANFIWRRRTLLWLLGSFTIANFTGTFMNVLEPLIVKFNLAPDWQSHMEFAQALSWLASAGGVGGLIGGLGISLWGGLKKRRVFGVLVPMVFAGVGQVIFGLSPLLILSAGMAFLVTAMIPLMNAHSQAIWQTQTPRELQGRVFAVRRVIAQFTVPLSQFLAGVFGGLFNPGLVVAIMGAVFALFSFGQLFNPYMLKVEDKENLDRMAALDGKQQAAEPSSAEAQ